MLPCSLLMDDISTKKNIKELEWLVFQICAIGEEQY